MKTETTTASPTVAEVERDVEARSAVLKKELGLFDLVLTQIMFVVGTFWVGWAARLGHEQNLFWILAIVTFYLPLAAAVIFLIRLMPLEGGLYQWTKLAFNEFVAFMVGWNLWVFAISILAGVGFASGINALFDASGYGIPHSNASLAWGNRQNMTAITRLLAGLALLLVPAMTAGPGAAEPHRADVDPLRERRGLPRGARLAGPAGLQLTLFEELEAKALGSVRVTTAQPERLRDALLSAGFEATQASDRELLVSAGAEEVWAVSSDAGVPLSGLQDEHRNLEDIFFELTGSR